MSDTPIPAFAKISKAHEITGVSQWYIRKGCLDGSIPCFRSGNTIYVNVRELLNQLDHLSKSGGGANNGNQADVQQCSH